MFGHICVQTMGNIRSNIRYFRRQVRYYRKRVEEIDKYGRENGCESDADAEAG
jgi:hypothetical protein